MVKFSLIFVMVFGLMIASCSDDETTPEVTPDTAITQDDGGMTDDMDNTGDDSTTASGACTNVDDGVLLDTSEKRDGISDEARTCGIGCLQDDDVAACATSCVVEATSLTSGCSACYVGILLCSMNSGCTAVCVDSSKEAECKTCMEGGTGSTSGTDCYAAFYTCSGLTE